MFRQVFFKAKYAYFFTWEIQHCFFHTLSWGNRKNKVSEINTSPLAPQQPHSSLHSYFSSHLHFVEWNKSSCTSSLVEGKKVISHFTVTRGFKKCFFNFFPHFSPSFSWDLDIVCPHKTFSVRTNVITIGFARLYFDLLYFFGAMSDLFLWFFFPVPETSVSSVQGSSVELPCNLTAPIYGDKVRLVLWFKNDSNLPIYT